MRLNFAIALNSLALLGLALPVPAGAQTSDQSRMRQLNPAMPLPLEIDQDRVAAAGIQRIEGKHIDLYTDVRDKSVTEELVQVFDAAIPRWCAYFEVDPERTAGIKRVRFARRG